MLDLSAQSTTVLDILHRKIYKHSFEPRAAKKHKCVFERCHPSFAFLCEVADEAGSRSIAYKLEEEVGALSPDFVIQTEWHHLIAEISKGLFSQFYSSFDRVSAWQE